jgi:hypothetical protein
MVGAHLMGGIGNQLFQVSAGIALARDNNDVFCIDRNIPFNAMTGKPPNHYSDTLYRKISKIQYWPKTVGYHEKQEAHFDPIPYNGAGTPWGWQIISGYFQSPKYFNHHKGFLQQTFQFPKAIINKVRPKMEGLYWNKLIRSGICGIHIRRGDYLTIPKTLPICPSEYYRECINRLEDGGIHTRWTYIVCTDSPEYVTKEFAKEFDSDQFILSNSTDELEDLYILTQSDAVIMSNSSFSWWGAYLGKQKWNVFAPQKWFGPDGPKDWSDIYCPEWKLV